MEWNKAKANKVLPRKHTGHSKHPLPKTQEKTLHMDITWWSIPKSDWFYSMQPKMEKLYTVNKNKTRSWLWLRSAAAAAAAAKSLQSCLTLCDPIDGSPSGSPVPGILQARTREWVAISFSNAWKWKVKLVSRVRLFVTPWTAAYQAPPPMGFSRQEYWSGVSLPSPSGFPYFLQFESEFANKEFMIWATVSSWSCFCWLHRASPSLAA